jgi:hypothetical protein
MSNCNIQERRIGDVTVLDMDGNIKIGGSNVALKKAILNLVAEGRNQIVLNLARVVTSIRAAGATSLPARSL